MTSAALTLEEHEVALLRHLLDEMRVLLEADIPRQDPVIGRIFPDAYEAADDAAAYRGLVEDELRAGKMAALRKLEETLGARRGDDIELGPQEVEAWLSVLADLRLAIGTRLEVTEDTMGAEIEPDDPDAPALSVLHWLGWLQESLLRQINP